MSLVTDLLELKKCLDAGLISAEVHTTKTAEAWKRWESSPDRRPPGAPTQAQAQPQQPQSLQVQKPLATSAVVTLLGQTPDQVSTLQCASVPDAALTALAALRVIVRITRPGL
jgi:hypothetical protein